MSSPSSPASSPSRQPYAQIFRYTLRLAPEEYVARFVDPYAAAIAAAPGLVRKTWMADFARAEFASFYHWEDRAAMERFMASEAVARVAAEPFLADLVVTALPVEEHASRITRGV